MTDTHTHSAKLKYTCNNFFRLYFHKKSPIHIFKVFDLMQNEKMNHTEEGLKSTSLERFDYGSN